MRDTTHAPDPALRETLEHASEGLLYLSEGEAPFEFIELPAPDGPLTPGSFRALSGAPASAHVSEMTLERFFHPMTEGADPVDAAAQELVPRYHALKETLHKELPDLRIFRVGTVDVRVYLVGTAPSGALAGLVTTAYET
jgi:hypothetical protein